MDPIGLKEDERNTLMNVLITGAGGFIGLRVVRECIRRGCRVFALVNRNLPHELEDLVRQGKVSLRSCDIREPQRFEEIVASLPRLDAVIHCAARTADFGRDRDFRRINFETVRHLTAMVRPYDIGVLVFVSSVSVYGMADFNGEAEDELPLDAGAANPYPKYKIVSEQWIRKYLPENRYAIIRPGIVWGEEDSFFIRRVRTFFSRVPLIIHFGPWKGENRCPLANVERVAEAAYLASVMPEARGKAVNVLDSGRTSVDELYRQVAERYFPEKEFRTIRLPLWCGKAIGRINTLAANLLRRKEPLLDPTLYAVLFSSSNLDFSCSRLEALLAQDSERNLPPVPEELNNFSL